jgi:hypothetical protein
VPRYENTRAECNAESREFGPAEDVLERESRLTSGDQLVEFLRGAGRLDEQPGLVFGEDASGGSESRHDRGGFHHPIMAGVAPDVEVTP